MPDIGQIHRNEYELEVGRTSSGKAKLPEIIPVSIAEAPGRIHFLGDQGEPEDGYYLSAAVDCCIQAAVSMRKDNSVRFFAVNLGERKRSTLSNIKYRREDRWANYLKPAIALFQELGCPMKGLNFSFSGDIPQQIAMASSTAIEIAAAIALRNLLRVQINDLDFAEKLKAVHEAMFGTTESIADYLAIMTAKKDHFLLIDSAERSVKLIKSPFSRFRILLVDSHVPRLGVENEVSLRRDDILRGLELLSIKKPGARYRDFAPADMIEALGSLPEQIRRRSTHIVEEIHRINDAVSALERHDLASFARIIYHSHESLRDLYEISCPEIDWLVKRAQEIEGAAGSRMMGFGFGGSTYTIIRRELAQEYKDRMEEYERIFGFHPCFYEVKPAGKARASRLQN